jgi:hypothetical protein
MIVQSVGVSADGYRRYAQKCPELMNDTGQTVGQYLFRYFICNILLSNPRD